MIEDQLESESSRTAAVFLGPGRLNMCDLPHQNLALGRGGLTWGHKTAPEVVVPGTASVARHRVRGTSRVVPFPHLGLNGLDAGLAAANHIPSVWASGFAAARRGKRQQHRHADHRYSRAGEKVSQMVYQIFTYRQDGRRSLRER
jgi:hypothetical protein